MSQENYILSVYNPSTKQMVAVEVDEALYNCYRRSGWRMDYNDIRFRDHETPFSALKGGQDGAYENFDEFRSEHEANDPASLVAKDLTLQDLRQGWACLADDERNLLRILFFEGKSERQTAKVLEMPYMTVHDQKVKILRKLKNCLKN